MLRVVIIKYYSTLTCSCNVDYGYQFPILIRSPFLFPKTPISSLFVNYCCLHPSFSFFFFILLSREADFFEVEGCIGIYGGAGISSNGTEASCLLFFRDFFMARIGSSLTGSPLERMLAYLQKRIEKIFL